MRQLLWPGLLAALTLTGCAAPGQSSAPQSVSPSELAALAAHYDLAACPETDPDAQAIPGGLPATELACLDGGSTVNLAGLPREPMIINLWAQWCGPCRAESPYLREAAASLDGVTFLGINYDDPQPDWAIEFASLVKWDYPHVADPNKTLKADLHVAGLPTTLFVASDGTIAGVHAGELESTAQLKQLSQQYLGVS